jgi:hypothetical protein
LTVGTLTDLPVQPGVIATAFNIGDFDAVAATFLPLVIM